MKEKLIGVFNGLIWSFVVYILAAAFASLTSWSNCFYISEWNGSMRAFLLIIIVMIFASCIPLNKEVK
jgi:uncharacterized membrane protein